MTGFVIPVLEALLRLRRTKCPPAGATGRWKRTRWGSERKVTHLQTLSWRVRVHAAQGFVEGRLSRRVRNLAASTTSRRRPRGLRQRCSALGPSKLYVFAWESECGQSGYRPGIPGSGRRVASSPDATIIGLRRPYRCALYRLTSMSAGREARLAPDPGRQCVAAITVIYESTVGSKHGLNQITSAATKQYRLCISC
jgi:hypothetical protein